MAKKENQQLIPHERIIGKIYLIRGEKVMFDHDLAELYGVETKVLNQAVKRNLERFPNDFMFQLNEKESIAFSRFQNGTLNNNNSSRSQIVTLEKKNLRSQIVTLEKKNLRSQIVTSSYGGRRYAPYVFTEQGVAMLSAVLKSQRAVAVSIQVVRTFVKLREILSTHKQLQEKMEKIESKYDKNFKIVFQMIASLMKDDAVPKEKIGFK